MQFVYFTLIAIVLYLVSDWIVLRIEAHRGERLEHRSLLFFGIILVLALISFQAIELALGS